MTLAEHLREKIELGVALYAERARKLDEGYAAEVEKLARRTRDPVLAQYFRETMNSNRIVTRLAHIRALLRIGNLIEADKAFDRLRMELQFVEAHLQKRYLDIGFRKHGAEKSARRFVMPMPKIGAAGCAPCSLPCARLDC
jgi:hypothetical protein